MKFDFTQTWTQTFFLAVSHSVTLECFLCLCEALNRSYFCPIRLIRWKLILSLMTESRRDESHQSCSSFLDICSLLDKKVIRVIMQRNEIFVVFIQILPVHSKFNNELSWEIHGCPLVMIYISGVWLCWQIERSCGSSGDGTWRLRYNAERGCPTHRRGNGPNWRPSSNGGPNEYVVDRLRTCMIQLSFFF